MEYIRRFCKFLSEQHCIHLDCTTKTGFQKCSDLPSDSIEIQKKSYKNDDLDRSIHKDITDQELLESEDIDDIRLPELLEPEESSDTSSSIDNNQNIFINDYFVPEDIEYLNSIAVDDFNDNHFKMEN